MEKQIDRVYGREVVKGTYDTCGLVFGESSDVVVFMVTDRIKNYLFNTQVNNLNYLKVFDIHIRFRLSDLKFHRMRGFEAALRRSASFGTELK